MATGGHLSVLYPSCDLRACVGICTASLSPPTYDKPAPPLPRLVKKPIRMGRRPGEVEKPASPVPPPLPAGHRPQAKKARRSTPAEDNAGMVRPRCVVCLVPVRAAHRTNPAFCENHQPPVVVTADGRATSGGCRLHGHTDWHAGKRRCRICDNEAKRRRRSA